VAKFKRIKELLDMDRIPYRVTRSAVIVTTPQQDFVAVRKVDEARELAYYIGSMRCG